MTQINLYCAAYLIKPLEMYARDGRSGGGAHKFPPGSLVFVINNTKCPTIIGCFNDRMYTFQVYTGSLDYRCVIYDPSKGGYK